MLSLVYVSSATGLLSEEELVSLLRQSRENNTRDGITGMLLYKGGNFMQVVEGPEEEVRKLVARIERDPRHRGFLKLLEESRTERQFSEWSMGFENLDNVEAGDVPGYSSFLEDPLNSPMFVADPTRAQRLLLMFRRNM